MGGSTDESGSPTPRCARALWAPLLGAASLAGCLEEAAARPEPVELSRLVEGPTPLVVLGIDGADWDVLQEMADAGELPHLARLLRSGARGRLPPVSAFRDLDLGWVTVLAGRPLVSLGIRAAYERDPQSGARTPLGAERRRGAALWEVLEAAGSRVLVVGFDRTWAARTESTLVSRDLTGYLADQALGFTAERLAHPAELVAELARALASDPIRDPVPDEVLLELGAIPAEVVDASRAARPDPSNPPACLRRAWGNQRAAERVALELLARASYDVVAVQLDGLTPSWLLHGGLGRASGEWARDACAALYRDADRFLGELLERVPGANAVVAAAYGSAGPALVEGRVVIAGPSFRSAELGPCALDVLPTLAVASGLPEARDLPGRVREEALVERAGDGRRQVKSYDLFVATDYGLAALR